jgi:type II secretory pathway pseudopilin PulG
VLGLVLAAVVRQPAAAELQQYATQLQVQQLRQVAEQQQQAQAQAQHHQVTNIFILLQYCTTYIRKPRPLASFRKQHQVNLSSFLSTNPDTVSVYEHGSPSIVSSGCSFKTSCSCFSTTTAISSTSFGERWSFTGNRDCYCRKGKLI